MKIKFASCLLVLVLLLTVFCGCENSKQGQPDVVAPVDDTPVSAEPAEPVTLRIVGPWEDFPAIETVTTLFTQQHPECTVEYEYLQDYYASLEKRLMSGVDAIDLFITMSVQADSALLPYTLDLYSDPTIDLSTTFDGLRKNFEFRNEDTSAPSQLYAVPLGAEIRGLFVNTTLLDSLDIAVPTNSAELLDACRVLQENGYVPLNSNPGSFGQQLMYPYICNIVANADDYEATYATVNTRQAGVSELFREPMQLLYTMVENYYYNYKYVETEFGTFTDTSAEATARYFLNIVQQADNTYAVADNVGTVAFMPSTMSFVSTIAKTKDDYHSEIEFEFILSPVGPDGGYAYLSPAHGIAINKNSENLDRAIELLNFLFKPETNAAFAERHGIIANTSDAFTQISQRFSVPEDHISHLGEVSFDFNFYKAALDSLVEISKGNNPKYMNTSESGVSSLYPLDYYMERFEMRLLGTMPEA